MFLVFLFYLLLFQWADSSNIFPLWSFRIGKLHIQFLISSGYFLDCKNKIQHKNNLDLIFHYNCKKWNGFHQTGFGRERQILQFSPSFSLPISDLDVPFLERQPERNLNLPLLGGKLFYCVFAYATEFIFKKEKWWTDHIIS